jgi:anti-sigma regulatory factor (Ser/Thr protein kinase)
VAAVTALHAGWHLSPTERSIHATRHAIARVLTSWHVKGDDLDSALLVYAELAANALRHGQGELIGVHIKLGDAELTVDVTDGDCRTGEVHPRRRTGWDSETGRGLLLVAALADQWGTYPTPAGKGVWATVLTRAEAEKRPPSRTLRAFS